MALTTEQIHAAADALDAEGARPTLAAVRRRLGSGSFTTISEALNSWRSTRNTTEAVEPVPNDVAERVAALGQDVWAAALAAATTRLAVEREELAGARTEAQRVRDEAIELADALTAELDQLRTNTAAELAEAAERLQAAREETQQAYANAEQLRQSEQATEVALARATGAIETLTTQLDQAERSLADVRGELQTLQVTSAAELATLAQRATDARAQSEAALTATQEARSAAEQARNDQQDAQVARARTVGELETLRAERDRLAEQLGALHQRVGQLDKPATTRGTSGRGKAHPTAQTSSPAD